MSPVKYLFNAPHIPSTFEAGTNLSDASSSFWKYKSALQYQLSGRTPVLHEVLDALESRADALSKDMRAARRFDSEDKCVSR